MSDTPRTDAFNNTLGVVPADFARKIERELAALDAESEARRQSLAFMINERNKAEAELAALQRLRPTHDDVKKLEDQVDQLKEHLTKAIEIAKDALWLARIFENSDNFNEIDKLWKELEEHGFQLVLEK